MTPYHKYKVTIPIKVQAPLLDEGVQDFYENSFEEEAVDEEIVVMVYAPSTKGAARIVTDWLQDELIPPAPDSY
jgi:hypothetical protein